MIKLGEMQTLVVAKVNDTGAVLREKIDGKKGDEVVLPISQADENIEQGDRIEVFVYKDTKDKIKATTKRPKLTVGEVGYLKVVEITNIGAFLNWGLEKDLFLPHREQVGEIRVNGEYMVSVYVDKSERLCATMNLFNVLRTDSPFSVNDRVNGVIFSMRRGLGAMVAVEGKYLGMIHEREIFRPLHVGEELEVRINQIKEDGKLDLSLKDAPRLQIDKDGERIYNKLLKSKGKLPYNDNSRPEDIAKAFNMSKGSFKKSIGNLMKKRLIVITRDGIEVYNEQNAKDSIKNHSNKNSYGYGKSKSYSNDKYGKKDDKYGRKDDKFGKKDNYRSDNKFGNKENGRNDNYRKNDSYGKKDGYKKNDSYEKRDNYSNKDGYKKSDSYGRNDSYGKKDGYKKNDSYEKRDNYSNKDGYKKNDNYGKSSSYGKNEKNDRYNKNGKPDKRNSRPNKSYK